MIIVVYFYYNNKLVPADTILYSESEAKIDTIEPAAVLSQPVSVPQSTLIVQDSTSNSITSMLSQAVRSIVQSASQPTGYIDYSQPASYSENVAQSTEQPAPGYPQTSIQLVVTPSDINKPLPPPIVNPTLVTDILPPVQTPPAPVQTLPAPALPASAPASALASVQTPPVQTPPVQAPPAPASAPVRAPPAPAPAPVRAPPAPVLSPTQVQLQAARASQTALTKQQAALVAKQAQLMKDVQAAGAAISTAIQILSVQATKAKTPAEKAKVVADQAQIKLKQTYASQIFTKQLEQIVQEQSVVSAQLAAVTKLIAQLSVKK